MSQFANSPFLPNRFIDGAQVTWNNSPTSWGISPGLLRSADNNINMQRGDPFGNLGGALGGSLTQFHRMGGIIGDSEVLPNTLYYIYVAGSATQQAPVNTFASRLYMEDWTPQNNALGIFLPPPYTDAMRVGAIATDDNSNIRPFYQSGMGVTRVMSYLNPPIILNQNFSTTYVRYGLSPLIPSNQMAVTLNWLFSPNSDNNTFEMRAAFDRYEAVVGPQFRGSGPVAGKTVAGTCTILTDVTGGFEWKTTEAGDSLTVYVVSYIDDLTLMFVNAL